MITFGWTVGRRLLHAGQILARIVCSGHAAGGIVEDEHAVAPRSACVGCQSVERLLQTGSNLSATCPKCGAYFINAGQLDRIRGRHRRHAYPPDTETVVVEEWYPTFWRSRRVRIAPCPGTAWSVAASEPGYPWPHERIVCEDSADESGRVRVMCSCGHLGPLAGRDEEAVLAFNQSQGVPYGLVAVTAWSWSPIRNQAPPDGDLPF